VQFADERRAIEFEEYLKSGFGLRIREATPEMIGAGNVEDTPRGPLR
jgi:hypothetical protein